MDVKTLGKFWVEESLRFIYAKRPVRFNDMKNELDGITAKQLSKALTSLRSHKLITKHYQDYGITEKGIRVVRLLDQLKRLK